MARSAACWRWLCLTASTSPVMSAPPAAISRTSARFLPLPALPAVWSIGWSPAAEPARGSERARRMNRTGLVIALGAAFVVGVVFAVDPQLDLDIAGMFRDPTFKSYVFAVNAQWWVQT